MLKLQAGVTFASSVSIYSERYLVSDWLTYVCISGGKFTAVVNLLPGFGQITRTKIFHVQARLAQDRNQNNPSYIRCWMLLSRCGLALHPTTWQWWCSSLTWFFFFQFHSSPNPMSLSLFSYISQCVLLINLLCFLGNRLAINPWF